MEDDGLGAVAAANRPRDGGDLGGRPRDLGGAGQEYQDVAPGLPHQVEGGAGDGGLGSAAFGDVRVAGLDGKAPPRHFEDGGAQGGGRPAQVHRRGHCHHLEVGPQAPRLGKQGEGQVGLDGAFVELVQDDAA